MLKLTHFEGDDSSVLWASSEDQSTSKQIHELHIFLEEQWDCAYGV